MEPTTEHNPERFATWTTERKYQAAVTAVLDDGWNQVQASKHWGVSRVVLNRKCQAERERRDAAETASDERLQRLFQDQEALTNAMLSAAKSPLGLQERTRVPSTFEEFDEHYWGNWTCPDCSVGIEHGVHHEFPEFHRDIVSALEGDHPRVVINIPPYHAKSTLVTVKHTIWQIVKDRNHRTIIVSKNLDFAKTFLHSMTELLTNPDLYLPGRNLVEDYGPFRNDTTTWNKTQMYVAGRVTAEKDPTVQALGVGGQIYGRRADTIKADDVATLENQRNPARVQQMLEWFDKEVSSRVGRRGKLVWVGTRVHPGDIYSTLGTRPGYVVKRYPLILDEATESMLWPDHFTYDMALVKRAEMRDADFQLVYQNIDIPGLGASFSSEIIDPCKNTQRPVGHWEPAWYMVAGVDLAGGTAGSGYTAGVLLAIDLKSGKRFLVDVFNEKSMKAPQLKEKIFEWQARYPIRQWRVENNGIQLLALDTPILTTAGWSTMGDLTVGDEVFAPDGQPTLVEQVSEVHPEPTSYEVTFDDGASVIADGGHRWYVHYRTPGNRAFSKWTTTDKIMEEGRWPRIPMSSPLDFPEVDLPVDPYVLGCWLGDGSAGTITSHDLNGDQAEMRAAFANAGYETTTRSDPGSFGVLGLVRSLRELEVLGRKHVPGRYLYASEKQRLALLQGLMDTDGTIDKTGRARFDNTTPALIEAVEWLLTSLGIKHFTTRGEQIHYPGAKPIFHVGFYANAGVCNPFRLSRKAERVPLRKRDRSRFRAIRSVTPVASTPGRCIRVAHPEHLFLAGRELIPTGNSQLVQYNDEIIKVLSSYGVKVVPHSTQNNKWDPQFGVESLAPLFTAGMIDIPWANSVTCKVFQPLVDQLLPFPMGMTTDMVMAFWFADLGCRDVLRRAQVPLFDERMKVPDRIRRARRVVDFGNRRVVSPKEYADAPQMTGIGPQTYRRLGLGRPVPAAQQPDPYEAGPAPRFVNVEGEVPGED